MATATLPPKPAVVPFQAKQEAISQLTLQLYLSLRARARQLEEQIAQAEAEIRQALEAGAAVEPGLLRAFIKITERRNVAWKEVVIREKGQQYADRVLAGTRPDTYRHLVVTA
jgi:hypothetical protein